MMRNRSSSSSLRWLSVFLILGAVIIGTLQLVRFSRIRSTFAPGMVIAGVPVGGLDRQQSAERLLEVYTLPVELHYGDAVIHLNPAVVGFELDLESMLAAADLERSQQSFWVDFWNYLWGRVSPPAEIPLRASYSEARLEAYLADEVAARYDKAPTPAQPAVGTVNFQPGIQGTQLNVNRSVDLIDQALRSTSRRVVDLPLQRIQPPRPAFHNLEILLKQTISDVNKFDGLVGLYLLDLQNSQEIHFAYQNGESLPTRPDVAFTAASIIKIPILVSAFRRVGENPDSETVNLMEGMIEQSGNDPADWLMERVVDRFRGPMEVSADMKALGLDSTFLAGQFFKGAPLLGVFKTPANQREDVNTDPDVYNQTTPSDIGMLLEDIYQCSQVGGGALMAVFPGEFTQSECQTMINYLTRNKMPSLLEAGLPDGTRIAHKHGWVTLFGVMNTLGDAGIIFTPGGNYILAIFLYHQDQLIWEPASELVGDLSRAVYNYYNLPGG
jgi:beta-lactamase class A